MRVEPGAQRVHETDYGEPAFGGVFYGLWLVVLGIAKALVTLFERRRT